MKNKSLRRLVGGLCLALGSQLAGADDLMDVYRLAAESDPQLLAAAAARRAVLEQRPQVRADALLPDLAFDTSIARTRSDPSSGETRQFTSENYTLNLSQPVYHRDRLVQLRQVDARIAQADAQLSATAQGLITRVSERYFDVLAARDNLEFALAERNAIARQLEQAKQRFEVGLIAITDVHEAQARYDLAVAQVIAAENQLASAREALRELTGTPPGELAGVMDKIPLQSPDPESAEAWANTALEQNLQLIAGQFGVEVAREEIERQRSGYYPAVDLVGSLGMVESPIGGVGTPIDREDASIGLQLNLPLYTGGAIGARVREARNLFEQATEQLEEQRRSVLRQAQDAYRGVLAQISQVNALAQAVISNQSALEATEAGFEVGTRTIVDVLNAQRELFGAQRDFERARYDYILNSLRLRQAAGTLVVEDLEAVNAWLR